jgi:nitrogen regulatory protein PII
LIYPRGLPRGGDLEIPLEHFTVIVKPFKLDDVLAALRPLPVQALMVSEVRGYGRQKGHLELYEGSEYEITFMPKVRLEFVASRFEREAIIRAVCQAARTGRIGDGKVFITPVRATGDEVISS